MAPRALAALLRTLRANGVTDYRDGDFAVSIDLAFKPVTKGRQLHASVDVSSPEKPLTAQAQLLSDLFAHEAD